METASESMENPSAREKRKTPLRSAPEEARAGAEGGRYAAMKGNGEGSARAGMVKDECFPLLPGDRLLVASDGVGPYLDSLGPAGMRYLSLLSAEELVRSVLDGIGGDGAPNQDNATLICVEITGA